MCYINLFSSCRRAFFLFSFLFLFLLYSYLWYFFYQELYWWRYLCSSCAAFCFYCCCVLISLIVISCDPFCWYSEVSFVFFSIDRVFFCYSIKLLSIQTIRHVL